MVIENIFPERFEESIKGAGPLDMPLVSETRAMNSNA
jgi:hypothetical protein